jgi:hypothetical protein
MSFMLAIDATRPSPLDQLALDYNVIRTRVPSTDFCRQALGVDADDKVIAKRLGVAISTVRHWRDIGRRTS